MTLPPERPATPLWDDHPWTPLPRLEHDAAADVCVVGLGGSGLTALGELHRLGVTAVGLDACQVAGGAAGRNGGFLLAGTADFYNDTVRALGRERAAAFYRLTLDELDRIQAATPGAVRREGSLRIAASPDEEAHCAAQLAALVADGLPAEAYDGPEGRGILLPTDGVFNPLLRCRLLARALLDAGIALYEDSPAVDLRPGEVVTPLARVRCGTVLVAVDGNLELLLPELRGRVTSARLHMVGTAPAPEVDVPRPVYRRWGWEYWQQLPDGRIALGGFRDHGGPGEWTGTTTANGNVHARLETFLRDHIGARAPVTHRWTGVISFTEDHLPVFEEIRPGIWVIGAYSGTGNVIGALCGRAAAQVVVDGRSALAAPLRGVADGATPR